MRSRFRRTCVAALIGVGLLTQSSTNWLIEPHRMWIGRDVTGRDVVHFERSVPVPLYMRARSAFVANEDGSRFCKSDRFAWFLPSEAAEDRATPWPPRCDAPPPPGGYRIYTRISLCLWQICARPARFVSDPVEVTPEGRYRTSGVSS